MKANLLHGPALPMCLNCGTPIPLKRLKAVPYADHCRDCQELIDKEPAVSDSVLVLCEVDDWERARQARSYRHQRGFGHSVHQIGGVPQEGAA